MRINRYAPTITHLLFTDDNMLFGEASKEGAMALKEVLDKYALSSAQLINFYKSGIFFGSNVSHWRKLEVCQTLRVHAIENLEKHLGLPSIVGKNKKMTFKGLKEKCLSRFSWSSKSYQLVVEKISLKRCYSPFPCLSCHASFASVFL